MMSAPADDLSYARDAFAAWRSEHGRGRLPEPLWALALDLLERYSVAEVARELGLNQGRIRARRSSMKRHSATSPKTTSPAFVRLEPALLPSPALAANSHEVRVDVERPDGVRITFRIDSAQTDALAAVCSAFLRGAP
jgi:hypothetical protein